MDFENLVPGRDFLYLAFLLLGAGFGFLFNRYRKNIGRSFRSWAITLALLFFSGAVAALAAMLLYTGGKFYIVPSFYIVGAIIALLLIFALRFPRAVGFPLILVAGLCFVWIGFSFVQFPRLDLRDTPLALLVPGEDDQMAIQLSPPEKAVVPLDSGAKEIELEITCLGYAPFFPLLGGEKRGKITEISIDGNSLYRDTRFDRGFIKLWYILFMSDKFWSITSLEQIRAPLSAGPLLPGRPTGIYFDDLEP